MVNHVGTLNTEKNWLHKFCSMYLIWGFHRPFLVPCQAQGFLAAGLPGGLHSPLYPKVFFLTHFHSFVIPDY